MGILNNCEFPSDCCWSLYVDEVVKMGTSLGEKIMLSLLTLIGIAIIFIIGAAIYQTAISEKFTLIKDQWECTETRTVMQGVLVGKIIVNQPITNCSNYTMK